MNGLRLIAVYGGTCTLILLLVRYRLRRIRLRVCLALAVLPLALTGPAIFTASYYGALNLAYVSAPLRAQAVNLPLPLEEYDNGILFDTICEVTPWRHVVRESLKAGRAPLHNRFVKAGDVLLASAQPAPFDPKVWIGLLLPLATASTFACAFTLFLAALLGYLYLVEIGLDDLASLFGAATWMLSGFMTFWCAWSLASVFVTLPLILLGLRRLARGQAGGFGSLVVAWLLALVAGHPESLLYVAAAGGVVFLFELYIAPAGRWKATVRALAAGLLAATLAAPVLLPFVEALPQTADFALRKASGGKRVVRSLPLEQAAASAIGILYPYAFGPHWGGSGEGDPKRFRDSCAAFVGGLAFTLALFSALSRRREKWAFAVLGLATFSLSISVPGITDMVRRLPLFDIALSQRLSGVAAFCLAVLAALGFEAVLETGRRGHWAAFAAAGAVLAGLGAWRAAGMIQNGLDVRAHRVALIWLVTPVLLAALAGMFLRRRQRALALAWLGLLLVSRTADVPPLYRIFSTDLFYPEVQEFGKLPRRGEPYRITGVGYSLIPDQSALYGLEDVRGHNVLSHARWKATFPLWCEPQGFWFCRVDDLRRPFLSFLNVRYAVAPPRAKRPRGWKLLVGGPNTKIFRNPKTLPRAFAPRRIGFQPRIRLSDLQPIRDYSDLAWIESPEETSEVIENGSAEVTSHRHGPDLVIDVRAQEPAWVVVSQIFWKGWRAVEENGEKIPLHFANLAFIGFQVPAGEHRIRLFYRPRSFDLGVALSLLALIGYGSFLWFRRRAAGVSARPVATTLDC